MNDFLGIITVMHAEMECLLESALENNSTWIISRDVVYVDDKVYILDVNHLKCP